MDRQHPALRIPIRRTISIRERQAEGLQLLPVSRIAKAHQSGRAGAGIGVDQTLVGGRGRCAASWLNCGQATFRRTGQITQGGATRQYVRQIWQDINLIACLQGKFFELPGNFHLDMVVLALVTRADQVVHCRAVHQLAVGIVEHTQLLSYFHTGAGRRNKAIRSSQISRIVVFRWIIIVGAHDQPLELRARTGHSLFIAQHNKRSDHRLVAQVGETFWVAR